MGSAFHQLCPRYSGFLTPTAPIAIRLWETFTFYKAILSKSTSHYLFSNIILHPYIPPLSTKGMMERGMEITTFIWQVTYII